MRLISADYIFPVSSPPIKNGTIEIDDDGVISDVFQSEIRNPKSEIFKGVIVPGFINAHCHLELSYLKNQIETQTGLAGFVKKILAIRNNYSQDEIQKALQRADEEMIRNGIVAVGDISNDDFTFHQKSISPIHYHTFLEVFDIIPTRANEVFERAILLSDELKKVSIKNSNYSIVPHAPYTVSPQLFNLIDDFNHQNNFVLSMHNQETASEDQLFINKTGSLVETFAGMGNSMDYFKPSGINSIHASLPLLPLSSKILLVHNTCTTADDIRFAQNQSKQVYWCFCPNANLYIENKLPDFNAFLQQNAKCCLGTDSYASNWSLSVLDEMKTITTHAIEISFETLLKWATINGAEFFGLENKFGTIEKGKQPGLNLIENFDVENLKLTKDSVVRKLI